MVTCKTNIYKINLGDWTYSESIDEYLKNDAVEVELSWSCKTWSDLNFCIFIVEIGIEFHSLSKNTFGLLKFYIANRFM